PVGPVDADGAERGDQARADAGAAERAGGIKLAREGPHAAGMEEGAEVEHLRQPQPDLARHQEVRLAERARARLPRAGVRVEAVGGDGELVVAAQRYPVLRAAHREQLIEER